MWLSHRYRLDTLCLLLLVSYFALTQMVSADESATLNLKKAVQRTLERNPALIAFGYQIEAQKGRVTQTQLRPNIELGLEVENVAGSGAFEGIDSAETTLSLGWVLERGKRERRVAAARAGVSLFESVAEIQRMDVVAETARLLNLPVSLENGDCVPLSELAQTELVNGYNQVNRENGKRRIVVTANVRGRDLGSFVRDVQETIALQVNVPSGYWVEYGGTYQNL